MNIIEVLKEENVGKKYESDGMKLVLVKGYSTLWLQDEKTQECIEDMLNLDEIVRMDFKEIVNWSKVPVDTKILVSDDGEYWIRRYFAKYEGGCIYAFSDGCTSFTACDEPECDYQRVCSWDYAKLYEE